jgi:hypothetical protein
MNYLPRVASFRDLVVYQKARALQHEIFEISKSFPREETFLSQIRFVVRRVQLVRTLPKRGQSDAMKSILSAN